MNDRRFGDTDLVVSEICFGSSRIRALLGGSEEEARTAQRALERALERGVNFVHSSYEYGTRQALGKVLKNHPKRHDLHHIIKVPVPDFEDRGRFDPAKFRLRVEEALRDLGTDHIDVLQHLQRARPNVDQLRVPNIPDVHETMLEVVGRLKGEGKLSYLTTFPYTPGFADAALKTGHFAGMVAYYNLIEMEMAEFFPQMQAHGHGFFCIRPFMGGLLTDRRADRARLPTGDRFRETGWDAAYERFESLSSAFSDRVTSWTQFAIKFALSHPIVTSLIVGMNTPEQVDAVLDAADGDYPDRQVFEQAWDIFTAHGLVL
jgi:aryl-alcohol dehydrogenase-like predicted oxidoreductase